MALASFQFILYKHETFINISEDMLDTECGTQLPEETQCGMGLKI